MLNSAWNSSIKLNDFIFFLFLFNMIKTNIDIKTLIAINAKQMQSKEGLTRPEPQQLRSKRSLDGREKDGETIKGKNGGFHLGSDLLAYLATSWPFDMVHPINYLEPWNPSSVLNRHKTLTENPSQMLILNTRPQIPKKLTALSFSIKINLGLGATGRPHESCHIPYLY